MEYNASLSLTLNYSMLVYLHIIYAIFNSLLLISETYLFKKTKNSEPEFLEMPVWIVSQQSSVYLGRL